MTLRTVYRLDEKQQKELLAAARLVVAACPLWTPSMPKSGCPFGYMMSNAGAFGWISDINGYRYTAVDPRTGQPWPEMPSCIALAAVQAAAHLGYKDFRPESCLINMYRPSQKLGAHVDKSERCDAPVISISLGTTGTFALGGLRYGDTFTDYTVVSGDIVALEGATRYAYHTFRGMQPGTSPAFLGMKPDTRINLTIRQVNP